MLARFNVKPRPKRHEADELVTAEGAPGFAREPRAELFLLGVSNMVGEDTFYEGAANRDGQLAGRGLVGATRASATSAGG